MYTEFACYNNPIGPEVQQEVFKAIELGAKGISLPIIHLSTISPFLPDDVLLSCPIDYPYGHADTELRVHYAVKACHFGAKALDIVASVHMYYNNRPAFIRDLDSLRVLCDRKAVSGRIMIDYRNLIDLVCLCMAVYQGSF